MQSLTLLDVCLGIVVYHQSYGAYAPGRQTAMSTQTWGVTPHMQYHRFLREYEAVRFKRSFLYLLSRFNLTVKSWYEDRSPVSEVLTREAALAFLDGLNHLDRGMWMAMVDYYDLTGTDLVAQATESGLEL